MGGKFRKHASRRSEQMETVSRGSSSLLSIGVLSSRFPEQTNAEFYVEFKKELTKENVHELQILFSMVNVAAEGVKRCLIRYIGMPEFRQTFKVELQKYGFNLNMFENEEKVVTETLKNHCFAVLSTHSDIIDNINDPIAIENILYHTATSHCGISNIASNFKMHDIILQKCLLEEFGKYMHKSAHRSLKKYMLLINNRLQTLTEEWSHSSASSDLSEYMEKQKKFVRRFDKFNKFTQIYRNSNASSSSECALVNSTKPAVYPGTSSI